MTKLRLAILISGRGSNMEALVEATQKEGFPAESVLVMSNRNDAAGLRFAAAHGIETIAVPHKDFANDREAFERAMHVHLQRCNVDIIALAGFMRILTPWFVRQWDGKLINIHPSLLP
ncbi:MAG: phosphoribosylglycinamide formyltransferase, partial [Henriciella sp.]